ncbi:MAG: ribokinase [Clostridiales bacterium]|jgi:ribokinase|nr:ribokinase [Clostridiales bacterium]
MRVLNLGSLNIDKVYYVGEFVRAGETARASGMKEFAGGKGLNQSVALTRAGAEVFHAGAIGRDGGLLLDALRESGADASLLLETRQPSGHAVIQMTPDGQNAIIVDGGANMTISEKYVDQVLENFGPGDMIVLQNEVSCVAYAMRAAKSRGLKVAFNPSPVPSRFDEYPLHLVDYMIVNEIEGRALSGVDGGDWSAVLAALGERFPDAVVVLTLGSLGSMCLGGGQTYRHGIFYTPVVDTTGAGDTFCGYFLSGAAAGLGLERCLRLASIAAALAVGKAGAAASVPYMSEVTAFEKSLILFQNEG